MMHTHLLRLGLFAAASLLVATTGFALTLKLHDQTSSCTVSSVPSVFAPTQEQFDSVAADDFDVPAGESWGITQVNTFGVYGVFEGRTRAVNVGIFADSNGVPGGDVVPGCGYTVDIGAFQTGDSPFNSGFE